MIAKIVSLFRFFLALSVLISSVCYADTLTLPALLTSATPCSEENKAKANELYERAKKIASENNGYDAMQLAIEALRYNPDHAEIRELFGFKLRDGLWRTSWEIGRLNEGYLDHPTFGWILAEHVDFYESGKRFIPNLGWVDTTEDELRHKDIKSGWIIKSEHYDLITNHSIEEGVRTVRTLEHLYRAWKLIFFELLYSNERLAEIFAQETSQRKVPAIPRHKVILFRDKNDYVKTLGGIEPGIERMLLLSSGFYHPKTKTSYFFAIANDMDDFEADYVAKTILHEGTHQLFQEAKSAGILPGVKSNFWSVEGIAILMETLKVEEMLYKIGDGDSHRIKAAKFQLETGKFNISMTDIIKLGRDDFQNQKEQSKLYSQIAAFTHFLVFYDDGRFRDAFFKLVIAVHRGTANTGSLKKMTQTSESELDIMFQKFLMQGDVM